MANESQFTGKAGFYSGRPHYPQECIDYLVDKLELTNDSVIADIGAGTGILTKTFLDIGYTVYAVEPNDDMFLELQKIYPVTPTPSFCKLPQRIRIF